MLVVVGLTRAAGFMVALASLGITLGDAGLASAARRGQDGCRAATRAGEHVRVSRQAGMSTRGAPDGRLDLYACLRPAGRVRRVFSVPAPSGTERTKLVALRLTARQGAIGLRTVFASGDESVRIIAFDVRRPGSLRALDATPAQPTASVLNLYELVVDGYGDLLWRIGTVDRFGGASGDEVRADSGQGPVRLDSAPPHMLKALKLARRRASWVHGTQRRSTRLA
jgi:hypothetical protein